jgi:hypothetical protein
VAHQIAPEPAVGLLDDAVGSELHEVGRLLLVELVALEQPELHGRRGHALLEVMRVEAEAVAQELDDVVLARPVVGFGAHPATG